MNRIVDMGAKMLTAGNVAELAEVPQRWIRQLTEGGFLRPESRGSGKGNHHKYSAIDAVAVYYASLFEIHMSETVKNCAGLLESLVHFISRKSQESLETDFGGNLKLAVPFPSGNGGGLMLDIRNLPRDVPDDWANLELAYEWIRQRVARGDYRDTTRRPGKRKVQPGSALGFE